MTTDVGRLRKGLTMDKIATFTGKGVVSVDSASYEKDYEITLVQTDNGLRFVGTCRVAGKDGRPIVHKIDAPIEPNIVQLVDGPLRVLAKGKTVTAGRAKYRVVTLNK